MKETFQQYAAKLSAEERYKLEERAGIMEFQGNVPREMAERMAVEDHRQERNRAFLFAMHAVKKGA